MKKRFHPENNRGGYNPGPMETERQQKPGKQNKSKPKFHDVILRKKIEGQEAEDIVLSVLQDKARADHLADVAKGVIAHVGAGDEWSTVVRAHE